MAARLTPPPPEHGFLHVPCPAGSGRTLIIPAASKHRWGAHERPFRSVILSPDGELLSTGFPKFGNLGEHGFEDHAAALSRALADPAHPVAFTEKLDGSLIIRSVIGGQVVLRTRGTHDGGDVHGPLARRIAAGDCPLLLDPGFCPDRSLLLELTSPRPEARIVLAYERDSLVLIGDISHDDLAPAPWPGLRSRAGQLGLDVPATHDLPRSARKLAKAVGAWKGREGVVVRTADSSVMVKVKSAGYLTLHRLRFLLTAKAIREMCEEHGVQSISELRALVESAGGDWEVMQSAQPFAQAYLDARAGADIRLAEIDALVAGWQARHPGDRKALAGEVAAGLDGPERSVAFLLADGREHDALARMRAIAVDEAFDRLDAGDQAALAGA